MNTDLLDYPLEKKNKIEQDTAVDLENMSKIDKIKYAKKTSKHTENKDKYYYNALVDLSDKEELLKRYEKIKLNTSPKQKKQNKRRKNSYRRSLRNVKFGEALGINKLIIFPIDYYTSLGDYHSNEINAFFKNKLKAVNAIKKISKQLNLEIVKLGSNETGRVNVEQINDYALLSSWLNELNFQNNIDYIPATQKYINDLSSKYGTNYLGWIGINEQNYGSYELLIIDISTKKIVAYYNHSMKKRAFDFLKLNIYNSFYRVKNSEKENN